MLTKRRQQTVSEEVISTEAYTQGTEAYTQASQDTIFRHVSVSSRIGIMQKCIP